MVVEKVSGYCKNQLQYLSATKFRSQLHRRTQRMRDPSTQRGDYKTWSSNLIPARPQILHNMLHFAIMFELQLARRSLTHLQQELVLRKGLLNIQPQGIAQSLQSPKLRVGQSRDRVRVGQIEY